MNKQLIDKLHDLRKYFAFIQDDDSKKVIIEAIQSLTTEPQVDKVMEEEILQELKRKNTLPITAEGHDYNYVEHCSCNPKNGGSGICNCTLGEFKIIC